MRIDHASIHVYPLPPEQPYAFRAFLEGVPQVDGRGQTVLEAIEDLFTDRKIGKAVQQLERNVQLMRGGKS